jgi:hypothetical protein
MGDSSQQRKQYRANGVMPPEVTHSRTPKHNHRDTKKSMSGAMNAMGLASLSDEIGDEPDCMTREEFRRRRGY